MNREIKFRAWDEAEKEMSYSDGYEEDEIPVSRHTLTSFFFRGLNPEAILMQFTGLKDKNGKEIYEGDILKFELPVNGSDGEEAFLPLIVTISFHGAAFWFTGGGYTDCNWHFYNEENREIIGNIYENPELLKP